MNANIIDGFGGPEVLTWRQMPTPTPQPGEVLVRVAAAGVNLGDTIMRAGRAAIPLALPLVLGSEAAGTIEDMGEGVSGFRLGDRVLAAPFAVGRLGGGYASHICLPAEAVFPLPQTIAFDMAVALGIAGIAALDLSRLLPLDGRTILIHAAAGGVGNLLVQLGLAAGAQVIATIGDPAKATAVERLGATHVLSTRSDWCLEVMALTQDRGPDVIFDAVGGNISAKSLEVLAAGGSFVAYGGSSGAYAALPEPFMPGFVMKSQSLLGYSMMPILSGPNARAKIAERLTTLYQTVDDGALAPLIGHRLPIEMAAQAHELIESRNSLGKIVLQA